jgi:1-acyl-sn-glycerol-3-phosphate acyltransferase
MKEVKNNHEQVMKWWFKGKKIFRLPDPVIQFGEENIPPHGPYVIAINHRGWAEGGALWEKWPVWIYWMTKAENFKIPVAGKIFSQADCFPVKRDTIDREALRTAFKLLSEDKVVGMMIEGTRGREDDLVLMKQARKGTAFIANKAKVPILPVAVVESQHYAALLDVRPWLMPYYMVQLWLRTPPAMRIGVGEAITKHLETDIKIDELTQATAQGLLGLVAELESRT